VFDGSTRAAFFDARPELARAGYIYVGEDIRGKFKSEGIFVMSRAMADHKDPKAVDESTDAYDTVEWLLMICKRQQRGARDFIGTSYPGFLAMAAGSTRIPPPRPSLRRRP